MKEKRIRDFLILNVQVADIILGENIRGPNVGDTTDLQASIKERGIEEPLWVKPLGMDMHVDDLAEGKNSGYLLIEGRRRLTAAKAVGLTEVPCLLKMIPDDEIIDLMLTADMRKKQPPIVLDKEGNVVGGLCWAFYRQLKAGKRKIDIAAASGLRSDVVGAFVALYDDTAEMKSAVAKGRLAITVYSLVKHQPPGLKSYLLTRKNLSARAVRKEIKEWPVTEARLAREAAGEDDLEEMIAGDPETFEKGIEVQLEEAAPAEMTTAYLFNHALANISLAAYRDLEPTDIHILLGIGQIVADTLDRNLIGEKNE